MKKYTILDDPEKKINPCWRILYNQQLVIISRYLIEEEDKELVGEERDVEALAVKTEKDPLCNQNINNRLKVGEFVNMNGHRWMVFHQGNSHV